MTSEADTEPVLELDGLHVAYRTGGRYVDVVRDVSFQVDPGQTVGIVGESGCGKSTVAFAVMNYLGRNGKITGGTVRFKGRDVAAMSGAQIRSIRGAQISMVYQNPMSALNPSIRIGRQIAEAVRIHQGASRSEADARAREIVEKVHLRGTILTRYPHELSGGMQQRIVIAMALINNPDLLIMDEPTTGLDVTTEATVLDLVNELKADYDTAILYISHNLGVIAEVCDRVNVMYAGQVVEQGTVDEIFHNPTHPYAVDLLECVPRLDWHYQHQPLRTIEGRVPLPTQLPDGCVYAPRCRFAQDRCRQEQPELLAVGGEDGDDGSHRDGLVDIDHIRRVRCFFADEVAASVDAHLEPRAVEAQPTDETLLDLDDLRIYYPTGDGMVKAVDGIDFEIKAGETFSLVGESGCGKSTLGRCVVGLLTPTSGSIAYDGEDVSVDAAHRDEEIRRAMQIVFQNPEATLNPQHRVGRILGRTLQFFGTGGDERETKIRALLESVRLDGSYSRRYPRQLSGGEKQRVAIARAFAGDPNLVVCDEAVSALDVSVQASILNLLVDLKEERHCAYLFISHDLAVVRYISDRIGVMYLGRLMEIGSSEQLFHAPSHPYTEALLSAVQSPDRVEVAEPIRLEGSVPSPLDPPSGCPFHTRCPRKIGDVCETETPPWQDAGDGHGIFCHIPIDELAREQAVTIGPAVS